MNIDSNSKTTYIADSKQGGFTVGTFEGGWEFTKYWRAAGGRKKFWRRQTLSKLIAYSLRMAKTRKKSSKAAGKPPRKVGRPIKQYGMEDVVRMVGYCAQWRLPK
jgi:hypothetical protein